MIFLDKIIVIIIIIFEIGKINSLADLEQRLRIEFNYSQIQVTLHTRDHFNKVTKKVTAGLVCEMLLQDGEFLKIARGFANKHRKRPNCEWFPSAFETHKCVTVYFYRNPHQYIICSAISFYSTSPLSSTSSLFLD